MQPFLAISALSAALIALPVQVLQVGGGERAPKRVARLGRQVVAPARGRVEDLIATAMRGALPVGWQLERVAVVGDTTLVEQGLVGPLAADVRPLGPLRAGPQPIAVRVRDAAGRGASLAANATLRAPAAGPSIEIKRGAEVLVTARTGSVLVQTRGVAQSAAGLGGSLVVLCDNATRTLQATVVGPKAVEVQL